MRKLTKNPFFKDLPTFLFVIVAAVTLASCGGGGGGTPVSTPITQTPNDVPEVTRPIFELALVRGADSGDAVFFEKSLNLTTIHGNRKTRVLTEIKNISSVTGAADQVIPQDRAGSLGIAIEEDTEDCFAEELEPGKTCWFYISFDHNPISQNSELATLPQESSLTLDLSNGQGIGGSEFTINRSIVRSDLSYQTTLNNLNGELIGKSYDLGALKVDETSRAIFVIQAKERASFGRVSVLLEGAGEEVKILENSCQVNLNADESCSVEVSVTPTDSGEQALEPKVVLTDESGYYQRKIALNYIRSFAGVFALYRNGIPLGRTLNLDVSGEDYNKVLTFDLEVRKVSGGFDRPSSTAVLREDISGIEYLQDGFTNCFTKFYTDNGESCAFKISFTSSALEGEDENGSRSRSFPLGNQSTTITANYRKFVRSIFEIRHNGTALSSATPFSIDHSKEASQVFDFSLVKVAGDFGTASDEDLALQDPSGINFVSGSECFTRFFEINGDSCDFSLDLKSQFRAGTSVESTFEDALRRLPFGSQSFDFVRRLNKRNLEYQLSLGGTPAPSFTLGPIVEDAESQSRSFAFSKNSDVSANDFGAISFKFLKISQDDSESVLGTGDPEVSASLDNCQNVGTDIQEGICSVNVTISPVLSGPLKRLVIEMSDEAGQGLYTQRVSIDFDRVTRIDDYSLETPEGLEFSEGRPTNITLPLILTNNSNYTRSFEMGFSGTNARMSSGARLILSGCDSLSCNPIPSALACNKALAPGETCEMIVQLALNYFSYPDHRINLIEKGQVLESLTPSGSHLPALGPGNVIGLRGVPRLGGEPRLAGAQSGRSNYEQFMFNLRPGTTKTFYVLNELVNDLTGETYTINGNLAVTSREPNHIAAAGFSHDPTSVFVSYTNCDRGVPRGGYCRMDISASANLQVYPADILPESAPHSSELIIEMAQKDTFNAFFSQMVYVNHTQYDFREDEFSRRSFVSVPLGFDNIVEGTPGFVVSPHPSLFFTFTQDFSDGPTEVLVDPVEAVEAQRIFDDPMPAYDPLVTGNLFAKDGSQGPSGTTSFCRHLDGNYPLYTTGEDCVYPVELSLSGRRAFQRGSLREIFTSFDQSGVKVARVLPAYGSQVTTVNSEGLSANSYQSGNTVYIKAIVPVIGFSRSEVNIVDENGDIHPEISITNSDCNNKSLRFGETCTFTVNCASQATGFLNIQGVTNKQGILICNP